MKISYQIFTGFMLTWFLIGLLGKEITNYGVSMVDGILTIVLLIVFITITIMVWWSEK